MHSIGEMSPTGTSFADEGVDDVILALRNVESVILEQLLESFMVNATNVLLLK